MGETCSADFRQMKYVLECLSGSNWLINSNLLPYPLEYGVKVELLRQQLHTCDYDVQNWPTDELNCCVSSGRPRPYVKSYAVSVAAALVTSPEELSLFREGWGKIHLCRHGDLVHGR